MHSRRRTLHNVNANNNNATKLASLFCVRNKTSDNFFIELRNFHNSRKTPFSHAPIYYGRRVDFLNLYNAVVSRGGFRQVCERQQWPMVLRECQYFNQGSNASVALKQLYQRYLEAYERAQGVGRLDMEYSSKLDESDGRESDFVSQMSSSRSGGGGGGASVNSQCLAGQVPAELAVPLFYNVYLHKVSHSQRLQYKLSSDLVEPVEYHKLELSLLSGLANEVDFGLNSALLLSYQPGRLHFRHNARLVNLLAAQAGIFDEGAGSYYSLSQTWSLQQNRNLLRFWFEAVEDSAARQLLRPDIFSVDNVDKPFPPLDPRLTMLALGPDLSLRDAEGQRCVLVATILRNCVLDSVDNRAVLSRSVPAVRFLLLCARCRFQQLRQLGLDALVCLQQPLEGCPALRNVLIDLLYECLQSSDRFRRLRGLELLASLSHVVENALALGELLDKDTKSCDLLQIILASLLQRDLHLLVAALEVLLRLSTLGSEHCARLVRRLPYLLTLLLHFLTFEASQVGSDGLVNIKIMQGPGYVQPEGGSQMPPPRLPKPATPMPGVGGSGQRALAPHPQPGAKLAIPAIAPKLPQSHSHHASTSARPSTSVSPKQQAALPTYNSVLLPRGSAHALIRPSHTSLMECPTPLPQSVESVHCQQSTEVTPRVERNPPTSSADAPRDKRHYTRWWLNRYYEPCPQATISRVVMYSEFQRAFLCQYGVTAGSTPTAQEFHNCIKDVLPSMEQVKVQMPSGTVEIHYNHIKHVDDLEPIAPKLNLTLGLTGHNHLPSVPAASPSKSLAPSDLTSKQLKIGLEAAYMKTDVMQISSDPCSKSQVKFEAAAQQNCFASSESPRLNATDNPVVLTSSQLPVAAARVGSACFDSDEAGVAEQLITTCNSLLEQSSKHSATFSVGEDDCRPDSVPLSLAPRTPTPPPTPPSCSISSISPSNERKRSPSHPSAELTTQVGKRARLMSTDDVVSHDESEHHLVNKDKCSAQLNGIVKNSANLPPPLNYSALANGFGGLSPASTTDSPQPLLNGDANFDECDEDGMHDSSSSSSSSSSLTLYNNVKKLSMVNGTHDLCKISSKSDILSNTSLTTTTMTTTSNTTSTTQQIIIQFTTVSVNAANNSAVTAATAACINAAASVATTACVNAANNSIGSSATAACVNALQNKNNAFASTVVGASEALNGHGHANSTNLPSKPIPAEFSMLCQWNNCVRSFETAGAVYAHVFSAHFDDTQQLPNFCGWTGCPESGIWRAPFSLLAHCADKHCSAQALEASLQARRTAALNGIDRPQQSVGLPVSLGLLHQQSFQQLGPPECPPDAALRAVCKLSYPTVDGANTQGVSREGPVTKHIRLSSALVLRNLARHSPLTKRWLKSKEMELTDALFSGGESSRTVSQLLFELL